MIIKIKNINKSPIAVFVLIMIFLVNLSIEYSKYLDLTYEEIFETKAEVINIYQKTNHDILRVKADNFEFFTNISKEEGLKKTDLLNITFISKNLSFLDYLKSFYTTTLYFDFLPKEENFKDKIIKKIEQNHAEPLIKELFLAMFLATPISVELRNICTNYAITHLIALSGFHLVAITFLIYWSLYFPYSYFHTRFFPYRNKKYDLLLVSMLFLFYYLILTNIVPSLLRAFVMSVLGIFLLRSNIKIVSFETLFFASLISLSLFPNFLFSIGFWFSVIAVLYIFLFLKYFENLNKYLQIFFFNIWMFLVFNPIIHYFFPQTAYEQFISIILSIFFAPFFIFEVFAHIFDFATFFDDYINTFLNYEIASFDFKTNLYFLLFYILLSFLSIFYKYAFYLLNLSFVAFNILLYIG